MENTRTKSELGRLVKAAMYESRGDERTFLISMLKKLNMFEAEDNNKSVSELKSKFKIIYMDINKTLTN